MAISGPTPRAFAASRFRTTIIAALVAACALLALPSLAAAATGTIKVIKGGDRNTGSNTTRSYASGLAGATFQYSTTSNFSVIAGTIGPTNASGEATATVNTGTYYVRESASPAGWQALSPVQSLTFDPGSGLPTTPQPYISQVTVSSGQTTEVFPNRSVGSIQNNAAGNTGSPFVNIRDNATFPDYCGLKIQLVLDRSGSINAYRANYLAAAQAFVNALNGTPTQIGISSFSDKVNEFASTQAGQTGTNSALAPLNLNTVGNAATLNAKIADIYSRPSGGTNWDAALQDASSRGGFTATGPSNSTKPDLVVFITDGNPTIDPNDSDSGGVDLTNLTYGIASANLLKNVTAHDTTKVKMLAVGVGDGVTPANLKAVSGPNDDTNANPDYAASSVAALVNKLKEIAGRTCGARIIVRKKLLGAGDDVTPRAGWAYTATSPSPVSYSDPDGVAPFTTGGSPAQLTATLSNVPEAGTTATITEDNAGQPLPSDQYSLTGVDCRLKGSSGWNANAPFDTGQSAGSATTGGVAFSSVPRASDYYCTFTNTKLKPVVTLKKTTSTGTIDAGDVAKFAVEVKNAGPGTATNVKVEDLLPAGPTWSADGALPSGCSITNVVVNTVTRQKVTCTFPSLPVSTVTFNVKATTSASECSTYANTVSGTADNTAGIADASATVTCNKPLVTLKKTTSTGTINAGDVAKFAVEVKNAGPGTAKNVSVSDLLPPGPTWSADGALPSGCSIANVVVNTITRQKVTCTFPSLPVSTVTFNVKATTSATECSTYANTVSATGDNTGTIADASASVTCSTPNVTLKKTTSTGTINAGDVAKFAVEVKNTGPGTAKNVVVSDVLPAGPTWSADGNLPSGCSIADVVVNTVTRQQVTCTFDTLPVTTITFNVKATTGASECDTYSNTVTATGGNTGPIADASASVVCQKAAVTLAKTTSTGTIDAGDVAKFAVEVKNTGPGTASNVLVEDLLPAGPTWTADGNLPSGCSIANVVVNTVTRQKVTCTFPSLPVATVTFNVKATTSASECSTYENTVTGSAGNIGDLVPRSATVTCNKPVVTLTKSTSTGTIDAGDVAKFAVEVKNAGPGIAKNVTVSDVLPAGPTWSADGDLPSGCSIADVVVNTVTRQQVSCTFDTLAVTTISFNVKATTNASECGTYANTVSAEGDNTGAIENASATVVCKKPKVTLTKTTSTGTIDAGDVAKFAVEVKNAGPGTAKNVTVSDLLPAGPTWTADGNLPSGCSIADVVVNTVTRQQVSCTFDTLAVTTISFNVKATTNAGECDTYANTVAATGENTGPIADASATVTCRKPKVTLTKSTSTGTIDAGDVARFAVEVKNAGPGTAKNVTVSDVLPAGPTWTADGNLPSGCAIADTTVGNQTRQQVTCTFDTLPVTTISFNVKATTSASECDTYANTVSAEGDNTGAIENASATVVCQKPKVTLTKTTSTGTIDAGDVAKFAVEVKNAGPGTAKNVTVSDVLPAGPTWTADGNLPSGCAIADTTVGNQTRQKVTCTFDTLAVTTVTFNVKATTSFEECDTYENTVSATGENTGAIADATATVTCHKPAVTLKKTTSTGTISAGDVAKFAVEVTNAGPGSAKNVSVSDLLPAGPTWSADGDLPSGCSIADVVVNTVTRQKVTCTFDSLPVTTITFNVKATTSATECGTYQNTVSATGGNTGAIEDASATVGCDRPVVTLTKSTSTGTIDAGDVARFAVEVKNAGPGTAKNVAVSDLLPAGPTWSADGDLPSGCSIADVVVNTVTRQQVSCTFDTLAVTTISFNVKATTSASECDTYANTVSAEGDNTGAIENASATVVCQKPKVTLTKTTSTGTIDAGDVAKFAVEVGNAGPGTAKNVAVSDLLPAGPTWTADGNLPSGCSIADVVVNTVTRQKVTCTFDTLGVTTVTFNVKATTSFQACGTYANTVSATGENTGAIADATATARCRRPATVRIVKVVEGETRSETKFGFTSTLTPNSAGQDPATFDLSALDAPKVYTVRPGSYSITENDPRPKGYVLTSAACAPTEVDVARRANANAPEDRTVTTKVGEGDDVTCTFVNTKLSSALEIVKTPETQAVYLDGTATYTYKVTNTGSSDLHDVTVADDKCSPLTRTDAGNGDAGNLLEQGETWTYTCSAKAADLFKTSSDAVTNTATATAIDSKGDKLEAKDTAVTTLLVPGIALDKTGPTTGVNAGELITYNLAVTNTGNTSFPEAGIKLTDTVVLPAGRVCTNPADLATPKNRNNDQTPAELNPGETWVYQCQVQTAKTDTGSVKNSGTVAGTDKGGKIVTATDTAETPIVAAGGEVLPSGGVSGRARLTGSVGCVASTYAKASVSGSNIKQVTFYVNGRKVQTLTKPNSGGSYQLKLRTKRLRYGTYKVEAKVRFTDNATPKTKNLDLQFNRCRPRVIKPKFTG